MAADAGRLADVGYGQLVGAAAALLLAVIGIGLVLDWRRTRRLLARVQALSDDLRRSEEALREGQAMYRMLLEESTDAVFVFDGAGTIHQVNDTARAMLRCRREELLGKTLADILAEGEIDRQPIRFDLLEAGEQLRRERVLRRSDGSAVFTEIASKKLQDGRYLGIARDISERRRAEAALRRSEELFRALTENAAEVTAILDESGRSTYLSPSYPRVLGYDPASRFGRSVFELVHPEDLERVRDAFARITREPLASDQLTIRFLHADGRYRYLEVAGRNLLHDAAVRGVVIHVRDVSEAVEARARLEQSELALRQAQRMEAVGQLAGGIAHDFNNILTAIQLHAETLTAMMEDSDPRREDVREIQKAGERAASLTRQLLAFSRRQILQARELSVNDVVAGMHRMLGRLVGEDYTLQFAPEEGLPRVVADPGQLEQVLLNLVMNARDAMPDGGRIAIRTFRVTLDEAFVRRNPGAVAGSYIALEVADTGHGMSPEIQAHVFEPFFTTKPVGKGTGLGMSTVYGIVKQSGGYIAIDSAVGRGTTVTVYLSLTGQQHSAAAGRDRRVSGGSGTALATVLLVEDEPSVRQLARRILERAGFRVLEAPHGAAALEVVRARQREIDVVLSDVVMPEMSGVQLRDALRELAPGIPVVLTSGYTDEDVVRRGFDSHSASLLQKPFTSETLVAAVQDALDKVRAPA